MIIGYKTIKTRDFIESGKEDTLLLSIVNHFLESTDGRDHPAACEGSRHGLPKDGRMEDLGSSEKDGAFIHVLLFPGRL